MFLAAVATAASSPLLDGQAVLGVDDPGSVRFLGITLVGVSATSGVKLLVTVGFLLIVRVLRTVALAVLRRALGGEVADPRRFWARQGIHVVVAIVVVLGVVSIWVTPGSDLTTGIGLVTAGLAFALQQVVLSLAAYVVILRGDTFGVGDRIVLDEVRGDVVRLGFLKTTIMEMGTPPPATEGEGSGSWVASRQYTGRLVTVTNDAVFKKPVYNYSRDFPYLWEEIVLPISYNTDRGRAEEILLDAARAHAVVDDPDAIAAMAGLRARYAVSETSLLPSVYCRITDNWLELSLRFLVPHRGVREVKDRITRDILTGLDESGIEVASATYDIVGLPPLRLAGTVGPSPADDPRHRDDRA